MSIIFINGNIVSNILFNLLELKKLGFLVCPAAKCYGFFNEL